MRKSSTLVIVALALWCAAAAVPAAGQVPTGRVTPNTRLGADNKDPFRGSDIPSVAVDPADSRHLVLVNENFITGQCEFHVSFDGGSRWESGTLKAPAGFNDPPCQQLNSGGYPHVNQSVAFGSNQQVYVVFDSTNGPRQVFGAPSFGQGQGDSVLVARSTDGGRTFGTAVVAIQAPPGPFPFYIRPTICVEPRPGGDRVVVAAWGVSVVSGGPADGAGDRRMTTAVSDDGGATWAAPVDASAPGEQIREPSAAVFGPGGVIYVAWRNRDTGAAPSNVIVGKSTDGGKTWTRSLAGVVTGLGQGVGGGMPELGINRTNGALYLVYQETEPHGDQDIFFQRSTDGAATWSNPVRVNDDRTGNKVRQHLAHLSVAPNGRIDVAWLDRRNAYPTPVTPVPRGEGDVYYASSTDGGNTFSANRRITDHTINLDMGLIGRVGSYSWYGPVVASLGNDGVFFAWPDGREGTIDTDAHDIYIATLHLGVGGSAPVKSVKAKGSADLSVQLSQLVLPAGSERVSNPPVPSRVVLVNESDAAGALAGAVLARSSYGTELVTPADALPMALKDEIARIGPAGVYVIGDESLVSARVVEQVSSVVTRNVTRLGSADPAATAVAIAEAMDSRSADDKAAGKAAFGGAVVVNPESADAPSAAGFAAALRYPVLFTGRDAVPDATTAALRSLAIPAVIVVGGVEAISDRAMASLPSATRLGGDDAESTSAAVVRDGLLRGLAANVVFAAPTGNGVDAALMGAAAARRGGLLVVTDDPLTGSLDRLGLQPDQVLVADIGDGADTPWPVIIASLALAVLGAVMLALVKARRRAPATTS